MLPTNAFLEMPVNLTEHGVIVRVKTYTKASRAIVLPTDIDGGVLCLLKLINLRPELSVELDTA